MDLTFVYPTPAMYSGGVATLFGYANALAARGHRVTYVHGLKAPGRIDSIDEITWFDFDPSIEHLIVDDIDDPRIPAGDVVFTGNVAERFGLPAVFVLGHEMLPIEMERASFRAPCPKVCMARWLTDVGPRYGARPEQMVYVPTGIDLSLFEAVTAFEDRPVDVTLLYGAPHPAKGWEVGLAALTMIQAARPDLRVSTFSVPPPSTPIPDWMDFHLDPDRRHLAEKIYNSTKVFVQPSHHEGFGLTALEAMACGSALVTTDNGGSGDYAFDQESALVVPTRDPRAMADAIIRLLDDDDLRRRIASRGTQVAHSFTWERSGEVFEEFLLEYVADPDRFRQPPTTDLTLGQLP